MRVELRRLQNHGLMNFFDLILFIFFSRFWLNVAFFDFLLSVFGSYERAPRPGGQHEMKGERGGGWGRDGGWGGRSTRCQHKSHLGSRPRWERRFPICLCSCSRLERISPGKTDRQVRGEEEGAHSNNEHGLLWPSVSSQCHDRHQLQLLIIISTRLFPYGRNVGLIFWLYVYF